MLYMEQLINDFHQVFNVEISFNQRSNRKSQSTMADIALNKNIGESISADSELFQQVQREMIDPALRTKYTISLQLNIDQKNID